MCVSDISVILEGFFLFFYMLGNYIGAAVIGDIYSAVPHRKPKGRSLSHSLHDLAQEHKGAL